MRGGAGAGGDDGASEADGSDLEAMTVGEAATLIRA